MRGRDWTEEDVDVLARFMWAAAADRSPRRSWAESTWDEYAAKYPECVPDWQEWARFALAKLAQEDA